MKGKPDRIGADSNFESVPVPGEKGQDELRKRKPHLDLGATRNPRVLDAIEGEFKKEVFIEGRFQHTKFSSYCQENSGLGSPGVLAARCAFGALETRVLRNVFSVNMTNREAQNELCRPTKTPEEVYRIALFHEREDKYEKTHVSTGGAATSSTTDSDLQIKTEAVEIIRGGYRNNRGRGRGQTQGRGQS